MRSVTIKGNDRAGKGTRNAGRDRRNGNIPCVLYGGKEVIHFITPEVSFREIAYTPEVFEVKLDIDGKPFRALMKDLQFHAVTDKILHADFQEIPEGKPVVAEIPIRLTGVSTGEKEGGVRVVKLRKLKVKADIAKIPDHIEISVENLHFGHSVKVSDLKLEGIQILSLSTIPVVTIAAPRKIEEVKPVVAAVAEGAPAAEGVEKAPEAGAGEAGDQKKEGGKESKKEAGKEGKKEEDR